MSTVSAFTNTIIVARFSQTTELITALVNLANAIESPTAVAAGLYSTGALAHIRSAGTRLTVDAVATLVDQAVTVVVQAVAILPRTLIDIGV